MCSNDNRECLEVNLGPCLVESSVIVQHALH